MKTRPKRSHTARRRATFTTRPPRTVNELFSATKTFQDEWERAVHLVSSMRAEGTSFEAALSESGLTRTSALRLVKSAVRKTPNGRYVATRSDRLLRVLVVPSVTGLIEVVTRDSRDASSIAEYLNAVHVYLATGDADGLEAFRGARVQGIDGASIELITDPATLDWLGSAGVLSFESIYARGGGR